MGNEHEHGCAEQRARHLAKQVTAKSERRRRAERERRASVYFGLGMFGLVGWSVSVPTLIGIALGLWIDTTWPSRVSWTLTLMMTGVVLGLLNAWRWVEQERRGRPSHETKLEGNNSDKRG